MAFANDMEVFAHAIGYKSSNDMFMKVMFPVLIGSVVFAVALNFIFTVPVFLPLIILFLGFLVAVAIPFIKFNVLKADIQNNIHYMITYAGTLSTMDISHYILFRRLSEKSFYGYISTIFSQIHYLSKKWNIDYPSACKHLAKRTPSKILRDFLDRVAIAISFGEDLKIFLEGEQKAVMEDYSIEYQKSLESIKMVQEFFMALTIAFAFTISVLLFATLMMDINVVSTLVWAFVGLFLIDGGLLAIVLSIVPRDSLFNSPSLQNENQKILSNKLLLSIIASIIIFTSLFLITSLSGLVVFGIAILPLFYVAREAKREENRVHIRDNQFPSFIRSLGAAIEVRGGAVRSAIQQVKVHDFGPLNGLLEHLYRRWTIAEDKFSAWTYFARESGSKLISNFTKIFSESINLGGNGTKVGELISNNIIHQLSLRKLRKQQAGSLKGTVYGLFFGIVITIFISVEISRFLIDTFSANEAGTATLDFVQSIFPSISSINFDLVFTIVSIMLVFHALASSLIIKITEGGSMYTALTDFIVLVWIIAVLSLLVPQMVGSILPESASIANASAANVTSVGI
ncbi:MAG: type II secretion system F family protein [Candidatus Woesearchaeota archaeon]